MNPKTPTNPTTPTTPTPQFHQIDELNCIDSPAYGTPLTKQGKSFRKSKKKVSIKKMLFKSNENANDYHIPVQTRSFSVKKPNVLKKKYAMLNARSFSMKAPNKLKTANYSKSNVLFNIVSRKFEKTDRKIYKNHILRKKQ